MAISSLDLIEAIGAPVNSIPMKVVNHAGRPINFFWIDANNPSNLVSQTSKPLRNSSVANVNSYEGHAFRVKLRDEIPGTETDFVKGPSEETVTITFDEDRQQLIADVQSREDELNAKIRRFAEGCQARGEDLKTCLSQEILQEIQKMQDEKKLITHYRNIMANRLRNYTCDDDELETTAPQESRVYNLGGRQYPMGLYLDHDDAKIWTLDNFVSNEECQHIIENSRPHLKKATVAGEDGLDSISDSRRAQQTGYEFDLNTAPSDPLW
eukprot:scaffold902_cov254-Ochromonas_danica.AAC.23